MEDGRVVRVRKEESLWPKCIGSSTGTTRILNRLLCEQNKTIEYIKTSDVKFYIESILPQLKTIFLKRKKNLKPTHTLFLFQQIKMVISSYYI